ncbi:MAG: hypothetical protein Q9166_000504 [cf. Caloplaca sp. 2 TL-2023]
MLAVARDSDTGKKQRRSVALAFSLFVLLTFFWVSGWLRGTPSLQGEASPSQDITLSSPADAASPQADTLSSQDGSSSLRDKPESLLAPSDLPKDTLILYAYHETENARKNAEFFIRHGLHDAADFLFIFNGKETDLDKLLPPDAANIKVTRHENRCHDVGAYGEALKDLGDSIKQYKRFILLNSSIRGPFVPHWSQECWSDAYLGRLTDQVKLVGMSYNCEPFDRHVQSMILATDQTGLDVLTAPSSGTLSTCPDTHRLAIEVEIRITGEIKKAGYKVDAMMQEFQGSEDFSDTCKGADRNWEGAYPDGHRGKAGFLHPYETLFFKANRGVQEKMLGSLTKFTDASGYSSYDAWAGISDFVNYVRAYYSPGTSTNDELSSSSSTTITVDRELLEKVWAWLTHHPEIQVGENGWAGAPSLSEVERRNASTNTVRHEQLLDHASPTPQQQQAPTSATPSPTKRYARSVNASSTAHNDLLSDQAHAELRIYASTERRWQAIAGHAFDPVKIPRLDFACLSIIAAHREQGILQPDLVRISGQDKRSVPQRTQRLQDGGYISKIPILINKSHTSKMKLQRYAEAPARQDTDEEAATANNTILAAAPNSVENPVDFLALHRKIFDELREVKLITLSELKDKIGVTGLKWPMRIFASHLRRLERIGCIKQVRAHPNTEIPSPFLFRCVKYIRDPEGKEWNPVNFPGRGRRKSPVVEGNEPDASFDEEQGYLVEEEQYIARLGNSQQPKSLKDIERPIPQWSGDSTLSNLLYDLAHAAGSQGISTMELKDRSMGSFINRPVEHHVSRLVEMWQLSQPLHLRHLSIIRDAALTNGIPHYVHYSFENFKKLVDQGKASWEPVMTITKEHGKFKVAAAIDAEPDLDENGFPKITYNLFQGRNNDASLAECIQGADVKQPPLSAADPRAVKLGDGAWTIHSNFPVSIFVKVSDTDSQVDRRTISQYRRRSGPGSPNQSAALTHNEELSDVRPKRRRETSGLPNLAVSNIRGRGRKVHAEVLPAGFSQSSPVQKQNNQKQPRSQRAAQRYKKIKLVQEIGNRVEEGTDRYEATAAVFVLAIEQYREAGQEPPWDMMDELKTSTLAPSLLALQILSQTPAVNKATKYQPSMVAHSQPLREIEGNFVDGMLRSRIQVVQNVAIPVQSSTRPQKTASITPVEPKLGRGQHSKISKASALFKSNSKTAQLQYSPKSSLRSLAQLEGVATRYLPSVAAHTWPLISTVLISRKGQSLKRKQVSDEHVPSKKSSRPQKKKVLFGFDAGIDATCPTAPPKHTPPTQTYQQQLANISRPMAGFYVGQEMKLSQPGSRGRKRKSRLAVFKSSRVRDLAWFTTQTPSTVPATRMSDQPRVEHPCQEEIGNPDMDVDQVPTNSASYISSPLVQIHKGGLVVIKSPHIQDLACFSIQTPLNEPPVLSSDQPRIEFLSQNQTRSPDVDVELVLNGNTSPAVRPLTQTPMEFEAPPLLSYSIPYGVALSCSHAPPAKSDIGPKWKRSIQDDARRDSLPSGPGPVTFTETTALPCQVIVSVNGLAAPISEDQSPYDPSPPEGVRLSTLAGGFSEIQQQSPLGPQVSEASGPSDPPGVILEDRNERLGDDDSMGAGLDLRLLAIGNSDHQVVPNPDHISPDEVTPFHGPVSQRPSTAATAEIQQPTQQLGYSDSGVQAARLELATSNTTSTDLEEGTAEDRTQIRPSKDLTAPEEDSVPEATVIEVPQSKAREGVKRVALQRRTIAEQRRQVVQAIVERCGGVYPGLDELRVPFNDQWWKSGHFEKTDRSTLRAAVKSLYDNGTCRQLTFSFKDLQGLVVTRTIITKIDIKPTDPKVIEMQNNIKRMYPNLYIPQETGNSDQVRESSWDSRGHAKMRTVKDLEVEEAPVQLTRTPAYIEKHKLKVKAREDRKAQEEEQAARMRELIAAGGLPTGDGDAVARLLYASKRTISKKPQRKVDRLETLKRGPTGSRTADGKVAPTQSTSASRKVSGKQSQARFREHFRAETKKRLAELQQGRGQQASNQLDFSRMLTMNNFEGDLASHIRDEKLRQIEIDSIPASIEGSSPIGRHPWGPLPGHEGQALQVGIFRPYKKSGLRETSEILTSPWFSRPTSRRKSLGSDSHSLDARQQLYTIMEPEHFFHPATGTFAVNFSRCRTVNQVVGKYHWQGPSVKTFFDHVDDLMKFELNVIGLEHVRYSDWPFIDYTFPHNQRTPNNQGLSTRVSWFSKISGSRGYEWMDDQRSSRSASPDFSAMLGLEGSIVPAKRKQKRSEALEPFKTRKLTTVAKLSQPTKFRVVGDNPRKKVLKRRDRALTAEEIRRILIAVIVVRTLTGGVERHIDWVLVTKVFEPEHEQAYIHSKWQKVLQAHKVQAQQIQANFQALFLKAYQDGLVPPLDYNDLQAYDWTWLVNWTIEHIDTPRDGAIDLPSQRSRLDEMFHLSTAGDDTNLHTYYEVDAGSTILRREMDLHKKAWVQPLNSNTKDTSDTKITELEVLKTWIRANVATEAKTYNPQFARDKLAQFDAELIDQALKELLSDRVLMTANKGRLMPGRNYDLSEQYLRPLRKRIEAAKLRNVPMHKRNIERTLAEKGEMIVSELAEDAFYIAMQNMLAHRRISLIAKNPPMKKFGLTDNGSYKMRQMDKRRLHFDVGIQATDTYVKDNPLLPLPQPPSLHLQDSMTRIPLWYDINGDLIPALWHLALAATMSILVMRPGITAQVLEPSVRPSLALWEVRMILEWMVEARAAKKTGDSYSTEEWWWLCLDEGKTLEEAAKEQAVVSEVTEGQVDVHMGNT